ncbi:syndecan-4 [Rhincodon typus]|uniref:syndecan-4 n=1 Tax=Rhincodon typus TaxID=259920 RepID=UPI00202F1D13|nr:syndecan-4 [Rhincodon typus]XP_048464180.1 syndecan-4 [Rhincodon typus]
MFGIKSLAVLFLISLGGISSANTQKSLLSERNHFDNPEGSGFPGRNKLQYPFYEQEEGSGFASGDDHDLDDGQGPIDDEDDEMDNHIDESDEDVISEVEDPIISNEVLQRNNAVPQEDISNQVAMASTNSSSVFESTEMLAAMIAGGTIGLLFAILLILLLIYRMRKKDEGSYDLSKKPIYKKAPTTEFYA